MRNLNRIQLIGYVVRDPEVNALPNNQIVAKMTVATNRSYTTQSGESHQETQYHNVVVWYKLADIISRLIKKSDAVYVSGRMTYRKYTNKAGEEKNVPEIVMDDFIKLSAKEADEAAEQQSLDEAFPNKKKVSPEELKAAGGPGTPSDGGGAAGTTQDDMPF